MRFSRHKVVLRGVGFGVAMSLTGCGSPTAVAPPPPATLVMEAGLTDSVAKSAKSSGKARGPRTRPAQFLDPRFGK
jgi:hypothetical protein